MRETAKSVILHLKLIVASGKADFVLKVKSHRRSLHFINYSTLWKEIDLLTLGLFGKCQTADTTLNRTLGQLTGLETISIHTVQVVSEIPPCHMGHADTTLGAHRHHL